ncbi:hypothetical protein INS49_009352 [Diaporthe citri]|uniref:uncharacterized protein n=1 Tax=Diaporthe citri TaxID=83186 RepID=UPI001C7EB489|nr:uncharacterized protein INS49_009352 [Diaporthe citri]KAG6361128.1 hypothetical protein INS49_009352 [Diaporthe citri]
MRDSKFRWRQVIIYKGVYKGEVDFVRAKKDTDIFEYKLKLTRQRDSPTSEDWYDIETKYIMEALDGDLEAAPPGETLPPEAP